MKGKRLRLFARVRRVAEQKTWLRRELLLAISAGVAAVFLSRNWIGQSWSRLMSALGEFFIHFSFTHPHWSRVIHVALNIIPDAEFLVLALAGLVYLMPKQIDRIEKSRTLRWFVFTAFVAFAVATMVVNAINREEGEYTTGQLNDRIAKQGTTLNSLNGTNSEILKYFVSNKGMNEAEREANIEKTLRNEYILSHNPIDPEILAGNKMPPDAWMNTRLAQLGEKWKVITPVATPTLIPTPPHENAVLQFSLFTDALKEPPVSELTLSPDSNGVVSINFVVTNASNVEAENAEIWVQLCSLCTFAKEPVGFEHPLGTC